VTFIRIGSHLLEEALAGIGKLKDQGLVLDLVGYVGVSFFHGGK
jgi:hypothetical protein